MMKNEKGIKSSLFSCPTCSIEKSEVEEKSKIKQFFSNICIGHVALFLGAIYIAVMQLFFI